MTHHSNFHMLVFMRLLFPFLGPWEILFFDGTPLFELCICVSCGVSILTLILSDPSLRRVRVTRHVYFYQSAILHVVGFFPSKRES
ncbi:hypothetical protein BGZ60DRAFT_411243 [Tricladium varicosporioides]|nr:hypothetical protein BGZ60DRAFT_411243 [Hymenoscyphus varicosporioides]